MCRKTLDKLRLERDPNNPGQLKEVTMTLWEQLEEVARREAAAAKTPAR